MCSGKVSYHCVTLCLCNYFVMYNVVKVEVNVLGNPNLSETPGRPQCMKCFSPLHLELTIVLRGLDLTAVMHPCCCYVLHKSLL